MYLWFRIMVYFGQEIPMNLKGKKEHRGKTWISQGLRTDWLLTLTLCCGQEINIWLENDSNLEGSTELHLFCVWRLYYSTLWAYIYIYTFFLVRKWMFLLWEGAILCDVEITPLQTVFYLGKWLVSKALLVSRYMYRVALAQ